MAQVSNEVHILPFHVAPVLLTVVPHLRVRPCVRYGGIVARVVSAHKWAAWALRVVGVDWVIADVELIVLDPLVLVGVLIRLIFAVHISHDQDGMLEVGGTQVKGND